MAQTRPTRFLLGTHQPDWLDRTKVPLFVSNRRLAARKTLPVAKGPWALDSGGFSELSLFGRWKTSHRDYAALVRRYQSEIGRMEWCAPQDWMCEPEIIQKTGFTVQEHQLRSVRSVQALKMAGLPVIPVLQGWTWSDYLDCVELYLHVGIDLTKEPLVGIGSVCRRQSTARATLIVADLTRAGINLHGFGFKVTGLKNAIHLGDSSVLPGEAQQLASADSMAWSFDARFADPIPEHVGMHQHCNNCIEYALAWRQRLLRSSNGMVV